MFSMSLYIGIGWERLLGKNEMFTNMLKNNACATFVPTNLEESNFFFFQPITFLFLPTICGYFFLDWLKKKTR